MNTLTAKDAVKIGGLFEVVAINKNGEEYTLVFSGARYVGKGNIVANIKSIDGYVKPEGYINFIPKEFVSVKRYTNNAWQTL